MKKSTSPSSPKKTEAPKAEALPAEVVQVRVACKHPIGENGFTYHPGEVFTVPKDRYAALGALVEVVV